MANTGTRGFDPARLRHHREAAGLSQGELARRAHIPRTYINKYEAGHATPNPDRLPPLAAALGITPHDLLNPNTLGHGLASLRTTAGLKQSDLAERAGPDMTIGKYRLIERGEVTRLTHADTTNLARALAVTEQAIRTAHQWDLNQRRRRDHDPDQS